MKALSRDLRLADEVSASVDTVGQYELRDLVSFHDNPGYGSDDLPIT